ncbi:hypothetical protein BSKO_05678 [Bryopsis sp. KO-2023]|nr:hypothetical protein BSKO_05678 [Bryopsis sp. KO-2023]
MTSFRLFAGGYVLQSVLIEGGGWGGVNTTVQKSKQLLISTNSRLMWYDYQNDTVGVLSEAQEGVFYGMFPGQMNKLHQSTPVWVITRAKDWKAANSKEYLTEMDTETGQFLRRVEVDSKFTHDAVRRGNRVYVCDTDNGRILVLEFPTMRQIKVLDFFTKADHINTLAPLDDNTLWVVLHRLRKPSMMVEIDLEEGKIVKKFEGIGKMVHGLVEWGKVFVILDSDRGAVMTIHPQTGEKNTIWKAPEEGTFLKGLAVIDDVAFFGANKKAQRRARFDQTLNGDIVAVDLLTETMLWRRQLPTKGLLNIIGAPLLSETSTYKAVYSEKTKIGGHWPSGLPYMDLDRIQNDPTSASFYVRLTTVTVTKILSIVQSKNFWTEEYQKSHNAILEGRQSTLERFKPGIKSVLLIFSSNSGEDPYVFPLFHKLRHLLEPIINKVLGEGCENQVVRMQFASMPPGSEIKPHTDSGGYALKAHRIHVPITTPPGAIFEVCPESSSANDCLRVPMEAGHVFELNNLVRHRAVNAGKRERIHLIVDIRETPLVHKELKEGHVCTYIRGVMNC